MGWLLIVLGSVNGGGCARVTSNGSMELAAGGAAETDETGGGAGGDDDALSQEPADNCVHGSLSAWCSDLAQRGLSCPSQLEDVPRLCNLQGKTYSYRSTCGGQSVVVRSAITTIWHFDASGRLIGAAISSLRDERAEAECDGTSGPAFYGKRCSPVDSEQCNLCTNGCARPPYVEACQEPLTCTQTAEANDFDVCPPTLADLPILMLCKDAEEVDRFEDGCGGVSIEAHDGSLRGRWSFDTNGKLIGIKTWFHEPLACSDGSFSRLVVEGKPCESLGKLQVLCSKQLDPDAGGARN